MSTASDPGEKDAQQSEESDDDVMIINGSPSAEQVTTDNEDESRQAPAEAGNPASSASVSEESSQEAEEGPDGEAPAAESAEPQTPPESDTNQTQSTSNGTTEPAPTTEQPAVEESESGDEPSAASDDDADGDVNESDVEEDADASEDSRHSEEPGILDLKDQPSTFSIKAEASHLKQIASIVDTLVEEFRLRMTEDEMRIRAVDAANVGMVDVQINADLFESFTATPGVLGINLNTFKDALSLADSDDYVAMTLNPETRKLEVEIGNLDYTMGLIDPASIRQDPELPALELPADVLLEGSTLDRGVKAANMVSDYITISTVSNSNGIRLHAEGDTDEVSELVPERDLVKSTTPQEEVSSIFSLEYLGSINRSLPNSDTVQMRLGDEFPIELTFDTEAGDLEVTFMLAPRVEA